MRHISTAGLTQVDGWEERAQEAREEIAEAANKLAAATPETRDDLRKQLSAVINGYRALWSEFKPILRDLSAHKCWYCESHEKRSHSAVDHFRPKNAVKEREEHPGYWWLALQPINFRYSCTLCNNPKADPTGGPSLGKGTYFPLLDEQRRVFRPEGDLNTEEPLLLDPTVADDTLLIWFNEDGRAVPRYAEAVRPRFWQRADVSIGRYNLNDIDIKVARKGVFSDVRGLVKLGTSALEDLANGNALGRVAFRHVAEKLREMMSREAEFSATARAALLGFRDEDHSWIDGLFQAF